MLFHLATGPGTAWSQLYWKVLGPPDIEKVARMASWEGKHLSKPQELESRGEEEGRGGGGGH